MPSSARPIILKALAFLSAVGVMGADLSLVRLYAVGRTARTRTQLTDADFVRMRLLRTNGRIAIAVDLAGKVDRVNQSVLSSSWNGTISTAQQQRSIKGKSSFVIPELGNADASLIRTASGLTLSVTRQDGRRMNEAVVSETATGLLFAFTPQPVLSSETGFIDPVKPRRLQQQAFAPQLQRRAVAPAVGDIAVGTTAIPNPNLLNISGPRVSVKYRQTNARHAFEDLVSRGGYGFVWVPVDPRFQSIGSTAAVSTALQSSSGSDPMNPIVAEAQSQPTAQPLTVDSSVEVDKPDAIRYVNMTLRNQPYSRVFNALLMATQMQAKLEDGLVYVGPKVRETIIKSRFARTYRLNQVTASSAADYLANLGATVTKTQTRSTAVTQGDSDSVDSSSAATTTTDSLTYVQPYGAGTGPLLGLIATTDSRLQSVTLVGSNELIRTAEQFLKKIDLRQRQVALSIKILDITLDNAKSTENSFAFRGPGNSFIVSDRGELIGAFGNNLPPNNNTFNKMAGGADSVKPQWVEIDPNSQQRNLEPASPRPAQMNPMNTVLTTTDPVTGEETYQTSPVYDSKVLYDLVKSKIESSSTKVVVSPTLILSEDPKAIAGGSSSASTEFSSVGSIGRESANEAFVVAGTNEITSYEVEAGQNGAPNTCQPKFDIAGLRLGAKVTKIDDNGFVSFVMSPSISAVVGSGQEVPGCGPIKTLLQRRLGSLCSML